ncbi:FGGY-family carbohydrate kinase [Microbulbifer sp. YPW1]|uniref:FGGY-family carbohydrate kinase n=1 Tax=Microbulbifer sp. YPW1 TaxID=2745199 RepID=UPI0015980E0B|nr:FGGY family carbohydrate kinase [Microbulbifer sp. YPW1]QKX17605.1 L-fuculose kinase [Microbulbifer sp. YPW1]
MQYTLIFDIGKTHIKLSVLDVHLKSVATREAKNRVLMSSIYYPQADVDYIWQWFSNNVRTLTEQFEITRLNITTHGATAACLRDDADASDLESDGLALPVLDYEYEDFRECQDTAAHYASVRPEFCESYSPALPAGLNLGRQLHWQSRQFPDAFSRVGAIVMYPQYWLWRLTGERCNEVTSLGCHTDLWAPGQKDYSSLVDTLGWRALFPTLVSATQKIASPLPEVCKATGLAENCAIYAGVHDSNASYWRHRATSDGRPFTVISTGTWSIVMANGAELSSLQESRDMLANVDAAGDPIACARFMGGREYEALCSMTDSPLDQAAAGDEPLEQLQAYIHQQVMALPTFSRGGGPFADLQGTIRGEVITGTGALIASLYCALMLDFQLSAIGSRGHIIIEGAFLKNPIICGLLAQLRAPQQIYLSEDDTGTVTGCAMLTLGSEADASSTLRTCTPTSLNGLFDYRDEWRLAIREHEQARPPVPTMSEA